MELSTSSLGRRKILENAVSGRRERERENEERQLWKMENDSGNLDFRIGTT